MSLPLEFTCGACGDVLSSLERHPHQFGGHFYCVTCVGEEIRCYVNDEREEWPPQLAGQDIAMNNILRQELRRASVMEELGGDYVQQFNNVPEWRVRNIQESERIFCLHPSPAPADPDGVCNGWVGQRLEFSEGASHRESSGFSVCFATL
jgi:hypothetical protein